MIYNIYYIQYNMYYDIEYIILPNKYHVPFVKNLSSSRV